MSEMTLNNADSAVTTQSNPWAQSQSRLWFTPRFDLYEDDDRYALMGDLPGVEPQDLDVTYGNQEVTIHGKVKSRHTDEECFSAEYGVGDYHRSFTVGDVVEGRLIKAEVS